MRDALIADYAPVVDRIVGAMCRAGQRPQIEADDLRQEGYLALILTINSLLDSGSPILRHPGILEHRIVRNVRTYIVKSIGREMKHWTQDRVPIDDLR